MRLMLTRVLAHPRISCIADELRIVKDGQYGTEDPAHIGGWDGMVGELVRRVCKMRWFYFRAGSGEQRSSSFGFYGY